MEMEGMEMFRNYLQQMKGLRQLAPTTEPLVASSGISLLFDQSRNTELRVEELSVVMRELNSASTWLSLSLICNEK